MDPNKYYRAHTNDQKMLADSWCNNLTNRLELQTFAAYENVSKGLKEEEMH